MPISNLRTAPDIWGTKQMQMSVVALHYTHRGLCGWKSKSIGVIQHDSTLKPIIEISECSQSRRKKLLQTRRTKPDPCLFV